MQEVSDNTQKQLQYIQLIREWIAQKNGFIPYVWGGNSFTHYYTDHDYTDHETHNKTQNRQNKNKQKTIISQNSSYHQDAQQDSKQRRNYKSYSEKYDAIKTGFDCSGLILSATNLCNIPYFFKNTTTAAYYLKPLTHDNLVQDGDLIYFSGHIQIISDTKKGLIIEAAGYKSGYGKIHEIEVSRLFKHKTTIQDLVTAYYANEPLERINKDRSIEHIRSFKILRFSSVWEK
jgi:cell wall-associated NlpC family hydrolase